MPSFPHWQPFKSLLSTFISLFKSYGYSKTKFDELRGVIKSVLTDEFQTADAITSQIDGEDITRAKVIARLGQLVKNGEAEKTDVKTDDNRTVKAYKLAE